MFAFSPRKNLITVEILKHSSPLLLSLIPMMSWAETSAIQPAQLETIKVQAGSRLKLYRNTNGVDAKRQTKKI